MSIAYRMHPKDDETDDLENYRACNRVAKSTWTAYLDGSAKDAPEHHLLWILLYGGERPFSAFFPVKSKRRLKTLTAQRKDEWHAARGAAYRASILVEAARKSGEIPIRTINYHPDGTQYIRTFGSIPIRPEWIAPLVIALDTMLAEIETKKSKNPNLTTIEVAA